VWKKLGVILRLYLICIMIAITLLILTCNHKCIGARLKHTQKGLYAYLGAAIFGKKEGMSVTA
jgi:hypothetical protein